jgi:hypothetical protein
MWSKVWKSRLYKCSIHQCHKEFKIMSWISSCKSCFRQNMYGADEDCIQSSANIKSCCRLILELDSFRCSREPSFSIIIRIPKQIRYYSSRAVYIDENTTSLYDLWKKKKWPRVCVMHSQWCYTRVSIYRSREFTRIFDSLCADGKTEKNQSA